MAKLITFDAAILEYATPRQREVLEMTRACNGNGREAAERLKLHASAPSATLKAVLKRARVRGYKPPDEDVPAPRRLPPKEVHDAAFWRRKYSQVVKDLGEAEHICEKLAGVRGIPYQIPTYSIISKPGKAQSVVGCHWSDVHMGEVIAAEEIGGINEFNSEICRRRLRRYVTAACNIGLRWAEDTECVGVYFGLGGDLISGDIHDELRMTNDLTSGEQVMAMREETIAAIRQFLEVFGRVHVTCVPGNHGRNTPKATAKLYSRLSYDMQIGALVQSEFANDPRVTFQISAAKDQVTPIFGRNLLSTHGDKMGTGGGQGFAGPFLPIVRGTKKVQAQYSSRNIRLDYILHGHYHVSGNPGNVLSNGSVPGYSEYADDLRVVLEPPQQNLFLMHSRWGMRERMPIQLEDPVLPEKPRVRVPADWSAS